MLLQGSPRRTGGAAGAAGQADSRAPVLLSLTAAVGGTDRPAARHDPIEPSPGVVPCDTLVVSGRSLRLDTGTLRAQSQKPSFSSFFTMSARVEVRLPDQSIAQLDEMCSTEELSRAETIRKALALYSIVLEEKSKGQSFYVAKDIPDDIDFKIKELTFIG